MPNLTSKQRADLRSRAHSLKPLVRVGKEGVTPAAIRSLQQTLDTHDLIKVKVLDNAPDDVRETAHALAAGVQDASVVQTLGRIATLYRPLPEPKTPLPPRKDGAKGRRAKKA